MAAFQGFLAVSGSGVRVRDLEFKIFGLGFGSKSRHGSSHWFLLQVLALLQLLPSPAAAAVVAATPKLNS